MHCTTGVVTHYFRNKQELILFALHQVTERLQQRMATAIASTTGIDRLVAMLSSFLPIDQARQDILKVWVAFLGYAVGREELMAANQQSAGQSRGRKTKAQEMSDAIAGVTEKPALYRFAMSVGRCHF